MSCAAGTSLVSLCGLLWLRAKDNEEAIVRVLTVPCKGTICWFLRFSRKELIHLGEKTLDVSIAMIVEVRHSGVYGVDPNGDVCLSVAEG